MPSCQVEWRFAQDSWQKLDASSRRSSEMARDWRGLWQAVDCSGRMMMMINIHNDRQWDAALFFYYVIILSIFENLLRMPTLLWSHASLVLCIVMWYQYSHRHRNVETGKLCNWTNPCLRFGMELHNVALRDCLHFERVTTPLLAHR
jgi:hypothetical protein